MQKIPYGYCHCGCGNKTTIAKQSLRKIGLIKGEPRKYILNHPQQASNHPCWKGGRIIKDGYVYIHNPTHHRAGSDGYVREHIIVAEKITGTPVLRGFIVHHKNGNGLDNSEDNLVVCINDAEHLTIHLKDRAKKECGNENWRKCPLCLVWDDIGNMKANGRSYIHAKCHADYERGRRLRIKKAKAVIR